MWNSDQLDAIRELTGPDEIVTLRTGQFRVSTKKTRHVNQGSGAVQARHAIFFEYSGNILWVRLPGRGVGKEAASEAG